MRLLQHLMAAREHVADLQIQEPSLEDMFFATNETSQAGNGQTSHGENA